MVRQPQQNTVDFPACLEEQMVPLSSCNRRSVYCKCDGADSVSFSQTHDMYFSAIITVLKLQIHH